MVAIITLLMVLSLSILVTRIATILLVHTGLSREMARFQARSAFSGAGFTTSETEQVVNHPVRRRIIFTLILLGNAGLVTAVSTLIIGFVGGSESESIWQKVGLLFAGLAALWLAARSKFLDRHLGRVITTALRRYTDLNVRDYDNLLHLAEDYAVSELHVEPEDWICDRSLEAGRLRAEGVLVLGIQRDDGSYIGAPRGDTMIQAYDVLLCYGRSSAMARLDRRRKGWIGDRQHEEAVDEERSTASTNQDAPEPDEQGVDADH